MAQKGAAELVFRGRPEQKAVFPPWLADTGMCVRGKRSKQSVIKADPRKPPESERPRTFEFTAREITDLANNGAFEIAQLPRKAGKQLKTIWVLKIIKLRAES